MTTFLEIDYTPSADVETNDTIVLSYPEGQSSSTVSATGAKMWADGLAFMFNQASGQFSVAYSGSITVTYLGATSIPANSKVSFFLPIPDYAVEGAVAQPTIAALSGSLTGTVDGALADVAHIALSTSDTYTDSAVNTAVNAAIDKVNEMQKELQTRSNALLAVLKNAGIVAGS